MDRQVYDILLVEHDPADVAVFERALRNLPARLHVVRDGDAALAFLRRETSPRAPVPSLVVLNARAARVTDSGLLDAIAAMRRQEGMPVPVQVFGATLGPAEILKAYCSYMSAYTAIPEDRTRYEDVVRQTLAYWLTSVVLPLPQGDHVIDVPGMS
jgi:CheY-like chemotaxis protein